MILIFYKTNDVFAAEDLLMSKMNVEIVPTPVLDKAYCGVSIKIEDADYETANEIISAIEHIAVREA